MENGYSNNLLAIIKILEKYPNRPIDTTRLTQDEVKQLETYADKNNWDFEIYENNCFKYDL